MSTFRERILEKMDAETTDTSTENTSNSFRDRVLNREYPTIEKKVMGDMSMSSITDFYKEKTTDRISSEIDLDSNVDKTKTKTSTTTFKYDPRVKTLTEPDKLFESATDRKISRYGLLSEAEQRAKDEQEYSKRDRLAPAPYKFSERVGLAALEAIPMIVSGANSAVELLSKTVGGGLRLI